MEDKDFKEWISELKSKCDIVSVISRYCNVISRGRNHWTCCPFHIEKTPSLCIYDYEQTFFCYGCKENGDVVKFVQKIESCDFMQAVEILAKSVNMEVPNFSVKDSLGVQKRKKEKDEVLKVLNDAMLHYKANLYLPVAKPAQEYIKKRRLTKTELDDFGLGYSLDYTELIKYLSSKGYSYSIMEKAGLIDKNQSGKYYDVFGQRLTFPLFNIYNECIGFSARILTDDKTKAKYKNSSNTIVFDKSKCVFGLNLVRALKQKEAVSCVIIVEGQMDVIAMHKAGFKNTVAALGTAFTAEHAKMLKLISNNVIVCLDGDAAGQKATNKIVDIIAQEGLNVRAVKLPDGNDPDEYILAHGANEMKRQLDGAVDYIDFQIDYLASGTNFEKSDEKVKFIRSALALLDKLSTDSEKQIYLKHIKAVSGVPIDILQQDMLKRNVFTEVKSPESEKVDAIIEDGTNKAVKFILSSMAYKKDYVNYKFNLLPYLHNNTYVKLYNLLMEKYNAGEPFKISSLYDEFNMETEPNLVDIINYNFEQNGNNEKYYNECLWNIVEKDLKQKQARLNEQFQTCKEPSERKKILMEISNITKRLKNKSVEE